MFTGLIQAVGRASAIRAQGQGIRLAVDVSGLDPGPAPGASVAVDGACLTVAGRRGSIAEFDAVSETVSRTTLASLRPNDAVNLEAALRAGDPLGGHLVLGHVDAVGAVVEVRQLPEGRVLRFTMPADLAPLVAAKGSIAVSGVSLTVVEAQREWFTVSLIPETLRRTTLGRMQAGAKVNLEADVVARYLARQQEFATSAPGLTEEMLRRF